MITIKDKKFKVLITNEEIQCRVKELATELNREYEGGNPVFICILNGAFVFMADLVRYLDFQPDIKFARYSSYEGMEKSLKEMGKNLEKLVKELNDLVKEVNKKQNK